MFLAAIGVAIVCSAAVSFLSFFWKPTWHEDYGANSAWMRLCSGATATAALVAVAAGLRLQHLDFYPLLVTLVGMGILSSVMVLSFFTDLKLRRVDRHMLNTATILGGAFSLPYIVVNQNWILVGTSILILLFSAFLYLFTSNSLFGASDIRALAMLGVVLLPIMGWSGFIWGSFVAGAAFILMATVLRIVTGSNKNSVPAVPLLLGPYWATTLVALFLGISLATPQLPQIF